MKRKTYEQLISDLVCAQQSVQDRLAEAFPVGTWWRVRLRHGQVNMTVMRVHHHPGGIHGIVRFVKERGPRQKWMVKSIPYVNIIGPAEEAK